jgi:hypothetical protein
MFMTRSFRTLAAAATLALLAPVAQASTCDIANFTTSTDCVSPVTGGPGGNVTVTQMNAGPGVFGSTAWSLIDAISSTLLPGPQDSDDGFFTFAYDGDLQSGTWSLNPLYTWGAGLFAFAIKGATDNAVYLMDTDFTSGTWTVNDLEGPRGGTPDLSNVQLFGTADLVLRDVPPPPAIPLPAAGWMMIAGLGALAALRRRKG